MESNPGLCKVVCLDSNISPLMIGQPGKKLLLYARGRVQSSSPRKRGVTGPVFTGSPNPPLSAGYEVGEPMYSGRRQSRRHELWWLYSVGVRQLTVRLHGRHVTFMLTQRAQHACHPRLSYLDGPQTLPREQRYQLPARLVLGAAGSACRRRDTTLGA